MSNYTPKQADVILNANARWNLLSGATRSGKTFITYDLIVKRVLEQPQGNCILIGKTLSTLDYNVLQPMRLRFGEKYVTQVSGTGSGLRVCNIFGREFRCVGANDKRSVTKIQGAGLIYAYGDEVATWDKSIFDMLKSRLDSKHSKFDGTTNPDAPKHWLKEFIDQEELNKKVWNFVIDDNTYLDKEFIDNLKKEYRGSVYYDRYILGLWRAAEGIIYTDFANNTDNYIVDRVEKQNNVFVGVDFGGNKSGYAFNATAINDDFTQVITIKDYWSTDIKTPKDMDEAFIKFMQELQEDGHRVVTVYADSEAVTLKNGLQTALIQHKINVIVKNAKKGKIVDRIAFYLAMMSHGAYKIHKSCTPTIDAFQNAVWKEQSNSLKTERLDDGTSNIDTIDAQEYSTEVFQKNILRAVRWQN